MNPRYLIDSIVRQTTVLIAQLSTSAGIRAPLSHVADKVFVDLAREIESQGVGRKVAADMFGLALRTYQTKLQRLQQSASSRDRTLWQAVLDYIGEAEAPTREQIEQRFRHDGERAVAAVLRDLVSSGLAYSAGKGRVAIYRATSDADRKALGASADLESLSNLVWVHIYRSGPSTLSELAAQWPNAQSVLPRAVQHLLAEQRIEHTDPLEPGEARYRAATIAIPVGDELGWEAAVFDHFRAMATAIAHKLCLHEEPELEGQVGGTTLTFDLYAGHPEEVEVRGLLERVRGEANALWNRVKLSNQAPVPPERPRFRVTFYFGQNVEESDD